MDNIIEKTNSKGTPKITIEVQISKRINFASDQHGIPLIQNILIKNNTDTEYEDLELELSSNPKIIEDKVWKISRLNPRESKHINDRTVPLDKGWLSNLNEKIQVRIQLYLKKSIQELLSNNIIIASKEEDIVALAHNEWGGESFMPELIASFIMPNDPSVSSILKETSRKLHISQLKDSLEGYQQKDRKRVWQIISHVWSVISEKNLTYIEPPSSFETNGQKIRTPTHILNDGLATCLDTALLFSSCLEQIGLYPVIVFTKGHAFCGAWLQPQSLMTLTVDDASEIRKAMSSHELILFETTLATGSNPISFANAINNAKQQLSEDNEHNFIYALDLKQARDRNIKPLPNSQDQTNHSTDTLENISHEPSSAVVESPPDDIPGYFELGISPPSDKPDTPKSRLEKWKSQLLDLSRRNRLLNLREISTAIPIFCHEVSLLEDKLADGRKIQFIPPMAKDKDTEFRDREYIRMKKGNDIDEEFAKNALYKDKVVANISQKDLDKGLLSLYRKSRLDIQEGGTNTLFLAIGMLKWCLLGDEKKKKQSAPNSDSCALGKK